MFDAGVGGRLCLHHRLPKPRECAHRQPQPRHHRGAGPRCYRRGLAEPRPGRLPQDAARFRRLGWAACQRHAGHLAPGDHGRTWGLRARLPAAARDHGSTRRGAAFGGADRPDGWWCAAAPNPHSTVPFRRDHVAGADGVACRCRQAAGVGDQCRWSLGGDQRQHHRLSAGRPRRQLESRRGAHCLHGAALGPRRHRVLSGWSGLLVPGGHWHGAGLGDHRFQRGHLAKHRDGRGCLSAAVVGRQL
mmetsp:Transcript_46921/g.150826  ORF Transcript_46921/g.150826 Transcript_46921/m.150826 type:complete len:246 (+) Transcript_46921:624-1361(+)